MHVKGKTSMGGIYLGFDEPGEFILKTPFRVGKRPPSPAMQRAVNTLEALAKSTLQEMERKHD
jgi:hypothetical protein